MIVRQSDNSEYGARCGDSASLCQTMGSCTAAERSSDAFGTLHLEHSSTVDRVADELRRAVFEGELESGTPLREVALAESLGVSRPTLREALALLVAEGLATREPNRGVTVASPDPESVRDVSRVRAVLETAGVRHWPTAGEEARDAVRQALGAYESAVADGASYQELNQRHLAIHLSLVGLTESPRLVAMAESRRRRAAAGAGPDRPGPSQRPRPGRRAPPPAGAAGVRRRRRSGRGARPSTWRAPRTRSSSGSTSTEDVPTRRSRGGTTAGSAAARWRASPTLAAMLAGEVRDLAAVHSGRRGRRHLALRRDLLHRPHLGLGRADAQGRPAAGRLPDPRPGQHACEAGR